MNYGYRLPITGTDYTNILQELNRSKQITQSYWDAYNDRPRKKHPMVLESLTQLLLGVMVHQVLAPKLQSEMWPIIDDFTQRYGLSELTYLPVCNCALFDDSMTLLDNIKLKVDGKEYDFGYRTISSDYLLYIRDNNPDFRALYSATLRALVHIEEFDTLRRRIMEIHSYSLNARKNYGTHLDFVAIFYESFQSLLSLAVSNNEKRKKFNNLLPYYQHSTQPDNVMSVIDTEMDFAKNLIIGDHRIAEIRNDYKHIIDYVRNICFVFSIG